MIGENPERTPHPRIIRARESDLEWGQLTNALNDLEVACRNYDSIAVQEKLQRVVAGYKPQNTSHDLGNETIVASA